MANYATTKKEELIALAQEKGIEADASMTKAEIIAKLEEAGKRDELTEKSTEKRDEAAEIPAEKVEDPTLKALREQNEMLQKQMEQLQAQLLAMQKPQVIQVAADTERVYFLWQAEVADYNLVTFGPGGMYGSITGKTGTFSVPKNELSRILDNRTRGFIQKRWLIVLDGLTDDERESLGVAYKEGEILDRKAFERMVDIPKDAICEIYSKLCLSHKEMVARRFYEAWTNRNENVTRDKVLALRRMTKDMGLDIQAFQQILKEMNANEEEE